MSTPNGLCETKQFVKKHHKSLKRAAQDGNAYAQAIIDLWTNKPDGYEFTLFFYVGNLMRSMKEAQS